MQTFKYVPIIENIFVEPEDNKIRPALYFIVCELGYGSKGAEIGVWRGTNAKRISTIVKPKDLFLIDTWDAIKNSDGYTSNSTDMEIVKNLFKDDKSVHLIPATSKEASAKFKDGELDWVYIDANHTYEAVIEDIKLWEPKVRVGGVLSGHDVNCEEVDRAVKELLPCYSKLEKDWWVLRYENSIMQLSCNK